MRRRKRLSNAAITLASAAVLGTGCGAEPMTEAEIRQLKSLGPGLARMGEALSDAGAALNDAMCRLHRGFHRPKQDAPRARRCAERARKQEPSAP